MEIILLVPITVGSVLLNGSHPICYGAVGRSRDSARKAMFPPDLQNILAKWLKVTICNDCNLLALRIESFSIYDITD